MTDREYRRCVLLAAAGSLAILGLAAGGCGGDRSQELVVSAASSLTDAFEEIASDFEQANPGVAVLLNFDSSATLANQVESGAPVDVYASADAENMAQVVGSERTEGEPVTFAANDLVIVTRPGNEHGVTEPADLERVVSDGEVVALCARTAPCGLLAEEVLAGGAADPVMIDESGITRAPNARATLGAVTRGDAAAAIVYRTDAQQASGAVETIELDRASAVSTDYLAVALQDGPGDPALAATFVELLGSAEAAAMLEGEGFR
ncbi:MAG: molybdate ABC transporter substrate-binding protein [Microthrixaceae bacterium]